MMPAPGCTLEWPVLTAEQFYEGTVGMFVPGGSGRVRLYCTDAEMAAIRKLPVDIMSAGATRSVDNATCVVPTPAGVVAIVRDHRQDDLERELRPGRHDRGWAPKPDWRSKLAEMRRKAPFLTA